MDKGKIKQKLEHTINSYIELQKNPDVSKKLKDISDNLGSDEGKYHIDTINTVCMYFWIEDEHVIEVLCRLYTIGMIAGIKKGSETEIYDGKDEGTPEIYPEIYKPE